MKNLKIAVFFAGLLSMTFAYAHSGGHYNQPGYYRDSNLDRVNNRQRNQQWRIEQGIASGRLTSSEVEKLKRQQYDIARMEHHFKRDGWLSRKENRILRNRLNEASLLIDHLKNNDRYRPVYYDEVYFR